MTGLTKAQGGRYLERKVTVWWTDRLGEYRTMSRWLPQVEAFVAKRRAHGEPGPFFWRLNSRAPWHEITLDNRTAMR